MFAFRPEIRGIELGVLVDLACQEARAKRTEGHESDPQFFQQPGATTGLHAEEPWVPVSEVKQLKVTSSGTTTASVAHG
jgi:hypothetical protein